MVFLCCNPPRQGAPMLIGSFVLLQMGCVLQLSGFCWILSFPQPKHLHLWQIRSQCLKLCYVNLCSSLKKKTQSSNYYWWLGGQSREDWYQFMLCLCLHLYVTDCNYYLESLFWFCWGACVMWHQDLSSFLLEFLLRNRITSALLASTYFLTKCGNKYMWCFKFFCQSKS